MAFWDTDWPPVPAGAAPPAGGPGKWSRGSDPGHGAHDVPLHGMPGDDELSHLPRNRNLPGGTIPVPVLLSRMISPAGLGHHFLSQSPTSDAEHLRSLTQTIRARLREIIQANWSRRMTNAGQQNSRPPCE